jgi:hypothetical protein
MFLIYVNLRDREPPTQFINAYPLLTIRAAISDP